MKKTTLMLLLGVLFVSFGNTPVMAGEVDILINKLVDKGILSRSDAEELLTEMQKEGEREKWEIRAVAGETAREEVKEAQGKTVELPEWVEKTKLSGDLRLRYQGERRENSDGTDGTHRGRGRFRLRTGIDSKINPKWQVGFGIASGSDDPVSTNQTFSDTFQSPDLRIDYAYAQYQPFESLKAIIGKMKNPLWRPKDLIWDKDARPDGIAAPFHGKFSDTLEFFGTPAFFILDEIKTSTKDPVMWVIQGGLNWKFSDKAYFKFAPAYYAMDNMKGNSFTHSQGTNTVIEDDEGNQYFVFDYNAIVVDAEIGFNLSDPIPYLGFFGTYVQSNADDQLRPTPTGDDENQGWLLGVKFGDKKVKDFRQWQVKYNYRELERDAWVDFLPDSDFYGGRTNAQGHEIELVYGLHKNVTMGVDYYNAEQINFPAGESERTQDLIQLDLVLKW
jgi:polyhydroxyalkanoate synthesis regulator phasin